MAFRGYGVGPYTGRGTGSYGSLRREMDRLFEDFLGGSGEGRGASWLPAVDVREGEREIVLDVEIPGLRPEDVEMTVENGVLTISGERRAERKEGDENERYHVVERSYGSFMRTFTLPQGTNEEDISADYDSGVLTVRIPKSQEAGPRRIQIGRGSSDREVQSGGERTGTRTGSRTGSRTGTTGESEQRRVASGGRGQEETARKGESREGRDERKRSGNGG